MFLLLLNIKHRSSCHPKSLFIVIDSTQSGIEFEFTALIAFALSTERLCNIVIDLILTSIRMYVNNLTYSLEH